MMESKGRVNTIDILRAVAALAVVFQHVVELYDYGFLNSILAFSPGVIGVVVFFMVSGYIIPFSIRDDDNIFSFIVKRIFRIWPLYLMLLLIYCILNYFGVINLLVMEDNSNAIAWLGNILLIGDYIGVPLFIGVSWTLSIEIVWYVIFSAFFFFSDLRSAVKLFYVSSVFVFLIAVVSFFMEVRLPIGRLCMVYAAVFGYLTFTFHRGEVLSKLYVFLLLAFVSIVNLALYITFGYFSHSSMTWMETIFGWNIAILVFIVVMHCEIGFIIRNKFLSFVGKISYSIYLSHGLLILIVSQFFLGWDSLFVVLFLTFIISVVMYYYIEAPGVVLGKRFINIFCFKFAEIKDLK